MSYRSGRENKVADALLRQSDESIGIIALCFPVAEWIDQLKKE